MSDETLQPTPEGAEEFVAMETGEAKDNDVTAPYCKGK